ncbi:hypothetical protein LOTGIDRAFT_218660 [Lottia gigantea]|uniref:B30.2/SPRY domain-containing protein n=1 Tax=Lottia gigantea TaxID=225164 RepID=V3ZF78_LOTGI|nr:hypothetical protein LOTGIDRAFT_218660 [Lottia gigantea]ESO89813.1 hypothetical protein LOTGIDRAFT_218660 [Lottia gigantea]
MPVSEMENPIQPPSADATDQSQNSQDSEMSANDNASNASTETPPCYCEKPRVIGSPEIQCSICLRWFHVDCVNANFNGACLPFITNYQFCCKLCSPTAIDKFQRKQASFSQISLTALANLTHESTTKGESVTMFSKDKDIIPFIDKNWESITILSRRTKSTWHNTVLKTLTKETELFQSDKTGENFGLVNQDLSKIAPNYESDKGKGTGVSLTETKTRNAKRKAPFDNIQITGAKQKKSDIGVSNKLMSHGYPLEHPFNKDGYRYILAESDPHAANRQAYDDNQEWAGKPIPGYLYRTCLANQVLLALHDRAPQLKVSDDRLNVTGEKGYCMIRASHGVRYGGWYFEATIEEMPQDSAVRIGWSQSLGNLQAPCGYDKFSYSWRSRKGTVFHQSRGKHYSNGYEEGDVVGFYIELPKPEDPGKLLNTTYKDRPLVKFKSHLYYEDKDNVSESEKSLKPHYGSKLIMFKNGKNQGVAHQDLYEGNYFPAVSLYKSIVVNMNFGPDFKCPPEGLEDYRPMSDAAFQSIVDSSVADILFHVENEGKLPEF